MSFNLNVMLNLADLERELINNKQEIEKNQKNDKHSYQKYINKKSDYISVFKYLNPNDFLKLSLVSKEIYKICYPINKYTFTKKFGCFGRFYGHSDNLFIQLNKIFSQILDQKFEKTQWVALSKIPIDLIFKYSIFKNEQGIPEVKELEEKYSQIRFSIRTKYIKKETFRELIFNHLIPFYNGKHSHSTSTYRHVGFIIELRKGRNRHTLINKYITYIRTLENLRRQCDEKPYNEEIKINYDKKIEDYDSAISNLIDTIDIDSKLEKSENAIKQADDKYYFHMHNFFGLVNSLSKDNINSDNNDRIAEISNESIRISEIYRGNKLVNNYLEWVGRLITKKNCILKLLNLKKKIQDIRDSQEYIDSNNFIVDLDKLIQIASKVLNKKFDQSNI